MLLCNVVVYLLSLNLSYCLLKISLLSYVFPSLFCFLGYSVNLLFHLLFYYVVSFIFFDYYCFASYPWDYSRHKLYSFKCFINYYLLGILNNATILKHFNSIQALLPCGFGFIDFNSISHPSVYYYLMELIFTCTYPHIHHFS